MSYLSLIVDASSKFTAFNAALACCHPWHMIRCETISLVQAQCYPPLAQVLNNHNGWRGFLTLDWNLSSSFRSKYNGEWFSLLTRLVCEDTNQGIGLWGHKPRNKGHKPRNKRINHTIRIRRGGLILFLILILCTARDGSKLPHSDAGARSNANSPVPPANDSSIRSYQALAAGRLFILLLFGFRFKD